MEAWFFCLNLSQIKTSLCFCTRGLLLSQLHTFQEYFAAFCHLFQIYRCHNRDIYERKRKRKIYSGGSIYVYADFHRGSMCHVRRTNTRGTDDLPKLRAGGFGTLPSQAKNENYNPILETFLSLQMENGTSLIPVKKLLLCCPNSGQITTAAIQPTNNHFVVEKYGGDGRIFESFWSFSRFSGNTPYIFRDIRGGRETHLFYCYFHNLTQPITVRQRQFQQQIYCVPI